jgi:uncharacterized membrane protein YsdA (DUF1294 family)
MDEIILFILIFLVIINLLSFTIMIIDKNAARAGDWRGSEGALFFLAIFFGGLGIYLGMVTFHHKTRKWYFYLGIPLIMIQNFCSLYLLYHFIANYGLTIQF